VEENGVISQYEHANMLEKVATVKCRDFTAQLIENRSAWAGLLACEPGWA